MSGRPGSCSWNLSRKRPPQRPEVRKMKSATGKNKGEDKVQYSLFFIQRFKGKVLFNVPMSDYTSLRVGGPADVMAFPQDEGDLKDLMAFAEEKGFIPRSELNFSYRRAEVPKGAIVTRAHMAFELRDPEEIKAKIAEFRERRKASSAISFPNAGSIFKNPDGAPAGRLIEEAGLKGERMGGAQVSEVHANYIVNTGGARAKDVLALMALVRDRVYSSRGVVLEPELKVVG